MLELTTTQIAARIGVSERTIQRWITGGHIHVQAARRGNKWLIEEDELERLAKVAPDEIAELKAELNELRKQVQELGREVDHLRNQVTLTSTRRTTTSRTPGAHTTEPVPTGTVTARSFAESHGLTRDKMLGWIDRQEIETTPTKLGNRIQHNLTPEQQTRVIEFWQVHRVPFQQCLHCPHTEE